MNTFEEAWQLVLASLPDAEHFSDAELVLMNAGAYTGAMTLLRVLSELDTLDAATREAHMRALVAEIGMATVAMASGALARPPKVGT